MGGTRKKGRHARLKKEDTREMVGTLEEWCYLQAASCVQGACLIQRASRPQVENPPTFEEGRHP